MGSVARKENSSTKRWDQIDPGDVTSEKRAWEKIADWSDQASPLRWPNVKLTIMVIDRQGGGMIRKREVSRRWCLFNRLESAKNTGTLTKQRRLDA
jgi:hypothetical protein